MKRLTKINLSKLGASELDERELHLVKGGAQCACAAACADACLCVEGAYDMPTYNPSIIATANTVYQHDYHNDDEATDLAADYTQLGM